MVNETINRALRCFYPRRLPASSQQCIRLWCFRNDFRNCECQILLHRSEAAELKRAYGAHYAENHLYVKLTERLFLHKFVLFCVRTYADAPCNVRLRCDRRCKHAVTLHLRRIVRHRVHWMRLIGTKCDFGGFWGVPSHINNRFVRQCKDDKRIEIYERHSMFSVRTKWSLTKNLAADIWLKTIVNCKLDSTVARLSFARGSSQSSALCFDVYWPEFSFGRHFSLYISFN